MINGAHDPEKLLQLLYQFISKFVLCPKCKNPETVLKVIDKKIHQDCTACGQQIIIPNTKHKLTNFIINHPPNEDTSKSKGKAKEKEKKKTKKNGAMDSQKTENRDDEEFTVNPDDLDDKNAFDDFGTEDLTNYEDSVKSLVQNLKTTYVDQTECGNIFYNLVKEKKETNQLSDINVQKILLSKADELKINDKATLVLSELLFTDNILEEINSHRLLFLRFCHQNQKAQKYLLGGIEKLIGDIYKEKLLNITVKIIKLLYDEDILDEEVLCEWHEKPSKKYVTKEISKAIREKARPFIKWLKEAEVEDDSDEENAQIQTGQQNKIAGNEIGLYANKNGATIKQDTKLDKHGNDDNDDNEEDDFAIEYSHRVSALKVETIKQVNDEIEEANDLNIDDI